MPSVYFLSNLELTRVKIGRTRKTADRVSTLQTGSADLLLLVGEVNGHLHVEKWFHEAFADARIHGEWFIVSRKLADVILRIQTVGRNASKDICPEALAKDAKLFERHVSHTKLTPEIVEEARGRLEHGEALAAILKRFPGVRASELSRAIYSITWKQLKPAILTAEQLRIKETVRGARAIDGLPMLLAKRSPPRKARRRA